MRMVPHVAHGLVGTVKGKMSMGRVDLGQAAVHGYQICTDLQFPLLPDVAVIMELMLLCMEQ